MNSADATAKMVARGRQKICRGVLSMKKLHHNHAESQMIAHLDRARALKKRRERRARWLKQKIGRRKRCGEK
jgi:hypothetical protein